MKTRNYKTTLLGAAVLAVTSVSSQAIVVMLSDAEAAGAELETWIFNNFSNVTEVRHGDYANFGAADTQEALLGTGAFATMGQAEVVIIGRSISSTAYSGGVSTGYNNLAIPVISLSAYTARQDGDRLGWHASGADINASTAGSETTVTAAGASILGLTAGSYDLFNSSLDTFNGSSVGNTTYGGGQILATIANGANTDVMAAYWAAGSAPGNTSITDQPAVFPGARLLFNLDNEGTGLDSNNADDFSAITALGQDALRNAIGFVSPLNAVPEPSSAVLGLMGLLGLVCVRKRG